MNFKQWLLFRRQSLRAYLFRKLSRWLTPGLKCWGVGFEKDMPPEFIITVHAFERMQERFKCAEAKIEKVVVKAWYSKETFDPRLVRLKEWNGNMMRSGYPPHYRVFSGFVFVFDVVWNEHWQMNRKYLVTVYATPTLPKSNDKVKFDTRNNRMPKPKHYWKKPVVIRKRGS